MPNALNKALTLACPQAMSGLADEGRRWPLLTQLIAAQRRAAVAEVSLGCLARLQRALLAQGVTAAPGWSTR
jgi:hypothetical protein